MPSSTLYLLPAVCNKPLRQAAGFTLVELMLAIAVLAILLGVGIPAMQNFIIANRLSGEVRQFVAANMRARSEAIMRGRPVQLCRSVNAGNGPDACDSGDRNWASGWLIVVPHATPDAAEVLARQRALDRDTRVIASTASIIYNGMGQIATAAATFAFTAGGGHRRGVCLASSGNSRVVADAADC
ncbi:GspH/FimT family pseudopilin [Paraherbaspirillum soli]|uniref:Type II secretion system protein H n=1 Tax=Paraherbaspirillum soli TaxID=631222 RepID=A0ABW0M7J0_9BURK